MPETAQQIATPATQAQQPRLMDRVRAAMRVSHYALATERTYCHWIKRFILFHGKRHPAEMGAPEVEAFLSRLATAGDVAASTQNQAMHALLYLYRHVLAANPDLYQANNRAYYAATRDAHIASARASYEKDKEGAKERIKLWAQSNPEKRAAIRRRWDELNREQRRASAKATRMADPGKELAKTRKRQAVLAQRLPAWADDAAIRTIYREAARLTKATGVEHHVDHDIPLRGRKVSGLHVHNNLKVVTADVNLKKGNRWEP